MWVAALAVAAGLWPAPPCQVVAHVAALDRALGQVSFGGPVCLVEVDARRWKFWQLCSVFVHEYGHIAGLPHSPDPLSVMYPRLVRNADVCRGKRPPQYKRGAVIRLDVQ